MAKRDIEGDIEGTCAPKLKTHRFSLSAPHNLLFIGADMRFPNQILGENYRDPYLYASSCSHGRMNLFQLTDDLKRGASLRILTALLWSRGEVRETPDYPYCANITLLNVSLCKDLETIARSWEDLMLANECSERIMY